MAPRISYVDPSGYGCGTKLPHNVTSLLGVMDGAQSDLRTGLPWQMVEIHEPTRLAIVVEGTRDGLWRAVCGNFTVRNTRRNWPKLQAERPVEPGQFAA